MSIGFESLFLHHGLSAMDEGWPLHAAMELVDGRTLYSEVFWVFPPGHLLPAWIAYALDPPGIILARTIYAGFTVAACIAFLFVARRLMPPDFALLAALLIAVAAPRSHFEHLLFGYRYLVWSAVALLFFHLRLDRNDSRWLFPAGLFTGIALAFRLTPAFAVAVAIGVGIAAASRDWRRWIREGLLYSAGLLVVWLPILLWMHDSVGLERFWIEMVVRPVEMTALQSKPIPPLFYRNLDWRNLGFAFAAFAFRAYLVLYLGFLVALFYRWGRAVVERRPFDRVFLLTFVVFGAVYFVRSMGRSDLPHLDSAIPPVAVLLAYLASRSTRFRLFRSGPDGHASRFPRLALQIGLLLAWIVLIGSNQFLDQARTMGRTPLENVSSRIYVKPRSLGWVIDQLIPVIRRHADADDTILVMSHAPLIYVLTERHSPGSFDLIMPGTFRTPDEERSTIARLESDPPAVVVWPRQAFDRNPERGLDRSAPELWRWILDHYRPVATSPLYRILVPKIGVRDGRDT
ncbi:MAG TPA: hypothetical protein ENI85_13130 [Deltaproteobacteria bacterium]|nr:hypothetical protein [Deltaproteobacteria bacterium]